LLFESVEVSRPVVSQPESAQRRFWPLSGYYDAGFDLYRRSTEPAPP